MSPFQLLFYATGTQGTPTDQIATVNEGSTWELVDTPKGTEAVSLGRNLLGEMAYLPENTRVTTALASTSSTFKFVLLFLLILPIILLRLFIALITCSFELET